MTNKTILITGASRGIGLELVKQYASADPTSLVLAAVRDPSKAPLIHELAKAHGNVKVIPLDASSDASIAASVAHAKQHTSHVDLLINNAGVQNPSGPAEDSIAKLTRADFLAVFSTNVYAPLAVVQAYLPLLKASASPVVVNISSVAGSTAIVAKMPLSSTLLSYCASKSALNFVTTSSATAYPDILFLAIHPGSVTTDMAKDVTDVIGKGAFQSISTLESATSIIKTVNASTIKDSGKFISYDGSDLPY